MADSTRPFRTARYSAWPAALSAEQFSLRWNVDKQHVAGPSLLSEACQELDVLRARLRQLLHDAGEQLSGRVVDLGEQEEAA